MGNQDFSLRRLGLNEPMIPSSIRLDVSYLSYSRYFDEFYEPNEYSSVKDRLIWNRLWRRSVHVCHKGGQHQEVKHRNSTAVHEIAL